MPTALVTGSSSGIGRALCAAFVRRGYNVVAAMRKLAPENAALADSAAAGTVRQLVLDVTDPQSVARAIADVSAREGAIDVLVNNAGVSSNAPLELLEEEHHRLTFETNYWGPVRLMRAVLPSMRKRKSGLIINISSMMRRMALPGTTPYAGSKAALEIASEVVAMEAGAFGVRVVVIEPGVVKSSLQTNTAEGGRWLPPDATPYATVFQQTRGIQKALLARPLEADEAAEIMLNAALVDDPPFRVLVGDDATTVVPARERMSDEQWIKLATPSEENRSELMARLGLVEPT